MNIWLIGRAIRRSNFFGLRKWINNLAYYDPSSIILPFGSFDYITVDNFKFKFNNQIETIQRVNGNPFFEGVEKSDIVLDIGANIGTITIPLASKAKKVFSVEPLFDDVLRENIEINDIKNVTIFKCVLGEKDGRIKITYGLCEGYADVKTFAELKEICGGKIDFLKCDCEGAEWCIKPEECEGIRELRFEFHIRRGHEKQDAANLKKWCEWFDKDGYKTSIKDNPTPLPQVLFKRNILVNASKKK